MAFSVPLPDVLAQAEYFVSPVGDDSGSGTLLQPFATLERARDAVRSIEPARRAGAVVHLRGGVHRLAATVTFDARDSAPTGSEIVYRAYRDETPVLSGGEELRGWTPHEKGIWQARAPGFSFRQLYVEGERATRARWPNRGEYHRILLWDIAAKEILVRGHGIDAWPSSEGVEMVIQMMWAGNILRVENVAFTGEGAGSWHRPSYARIAPRQPERDLVFERDYPPKHADLAYHFENAYHFLDEPGEWFHDQTAGLVYFKPHPGQDPNRLQVIAPRLTELIKIQGTAAEPVQGLRFAGLTFAHSTWLRPYEAGHAVLQAEQYSVAPTAGNEQYVDRPAAAVDVAHARDVHFSGCVFRLLGATALDFREGIVDASAVGNAVADIAGNGISLGRFSAPDTEAHRVYLPDDPREGVERVDVTDNVITRVGLDYTGSTGIAAGHVRHVKIEHNEVFDLAYTGISLGWGWNAAPGYAEGNAIRRNRVHRVMRLLADGGGIYTLSHQPGGEISENYIHSIEPSPWAGQVGIKAIYLDEGSGGSAERPLVVRRNVVSVTRLVTRYNMHRTTLTRWEGNFERESDGPASEIIATSGPRSAHAAMRARVVPAPAPAGPDRELILMTELADEAEAIATYERYHSAAGVWPEVVHALREAGYERVRIHRFGNRLVMQLSVAADADLDAANRRYAASSARIAEWDRLMATLQRAPAGADPGQIWVPMNLIFDFDGHRVH